MVKIDDHTVRIEYSRPSDNLFWVHFGKAVPAHQKKYSSQFHPEFRDKDELEALVKEAGFSNWIELYEHKLDIRGNANPERPILLAWALKQVPPGDYILERNPYFWAVDPAGNQLPYVDRIYYFAGLEPEVRNLKAQAGEIGLPVGDDGFRRRLDGEKLQINLLTFASFRRGFSFSQLLPCPDSPLNHLAIRARAQARP